MPEIKKVITAQRFAQGFTYQAYLDSIGQSREQFESHFTAFQLKQDDGQFFKDLVAKLKAVKVVVVGEDWCPDVHRGLPIIFKIATASGMELRFFPRDKNLDIMGLFLKEGKYQSIPVFAFFDGDLNYLCHWIERPAVAYRAQEQLRAELASLKLGEEAMRRTMREKTAPLADNWRQATVDELKELLGTLVQRH